MIYHIIICKKVLFLAAIVLVIGMAVHFAGAQLSHKEVRLLYVQKIKIHSSTFDFLMLHGLFLQRHRFPFAPSSRFESFERFLAVNTGRSNLSLLCF